MTGAAAGRSAGLSPPLRWQPAATRSTTIIFISQRLCTLAINPDECIDCGACEPECPTTAIFEESELPGKWAVYKDINALVSGAKKASEIDAASWPEHLKAQVATAETWPNITEQKKPLPGADDAAKEDNKIAALTLEGGG